MKSSKEILNKYIKFYESKGHKLIPNVSLVPENDPTLLFVNSGMFPLVPYLSGESHPLGSRLVNVQRSIRFDDLDEIGDNRHTLAFHMIGNWSLGDYFKDEQLPWAYEFLIEELGLDPNKMYATVFKGDESAPRDETSISLLQDIFKKYGIEAKVGERIFEYGKDENWWKRGDAIGELGGPDSEIFYYIGNEGNGFGQSPTENEEKFLEIGNSVFMQYKKAKTGWEELSQKNVDFGGGLERIALAVQEKSDIFETDNFWPLVEKIQELTGKEYKQDEKTIKSMRILADHMRAATFIAMDGVTPSNKDQGYVLRRLLRRMVRAGRVLGLEKDISVNLVKTVVEMFEWLYPQLTKMQSEIETMFSREEEKFRKVLIKGAKEVKKKEQNLLDAGTEEIAKIGFDLYQSIGYPEEMFLQDLVDLKMEQLDTMELPRELEEQLGHIAEQMNKLVDSHKQKSREGAKQKFSGGLADHSEEVLKYHTATHVLHWALRKVLGENTQQKGSNITNERLRFDVSHDGKLTQEEIDQIEKLMNTKASKDIPVNFEVLPIDRAKESGALHFFGDKYGEKVKVYYLGETLESAFSKEFCGGPHVDNLNKLDKLTIYKQKSIGKGLLRLYLRWKS